MKYTYREGCEHDPAQVIENEATVWFGGRLTMGSLLESELKPADYIDKIPEWIKKYGPGRVWVERVC